MTCCNPDVCPYSILDIWNLLTYGTCCVSFSVPKKQKTEHRNQWSIVSWLVVWNHGILNDFPFSWECHPNQLSLHHFSEEVNHQPAMTPGLDPNSPEFHRKIWSNSWKLRLERCPATNGWGDFPHDAHDETSKFPKFNLQVPLAAFDMRGST